MDYTISIRHTTQHTTMGKKKTLFTSQKKEAKDIATIKGKRKKRYKEEAIVEKTRFAEKKKRDQKSQKIGKELTLQREKQAKK